MHLRFLFAAAMAFGCFCQSFAIKITHGPYLQQVGENEATIMWTTDKDALSWVETAPDDGRSFYAEEHPRHYQSLLGRKTTGRLHRITVTGLQKGTTYRYRIFSTEAKHDKGGGVTYGKTASTNVYSRKPLRLTTADNDARSLHFITLNDVHADTAKLRRHISRSFKYGDVDFVLFNGDMVNRFDADTTLYQGFIDTAVELFAKETPFVMARGNHETRGNAALSYMDYFPSPTGQPYYLYRRGPVCFIVMDAGEDKPDNDIEYYGTGDYDNYRARQLEWVRQAVKDPLFTGAKYRIAVVHVVPANDTWHGSLHLRRLFMPVLNDAGIDLMLCGHQHRYRLVAPGEEGNNFPIVINSNDDLVDVKAGPGGLAWEIVK